MPTLVGLRPAGVSVTARRPPFVMPTQVGIHAFAAASTT
jgi:hypothetical protein